MSVITKKVCLIGDFGVGKTSLVRRFVERRFSEQYLSTIGVTISRKQVIIDSKAQTAEQTVQLLIWDIEGETKFQKIAANYLKSAHGVIVVADYSRPETLTNIASHLNLACDVASPGVCLSIVYNKADLVNPDTAENLKQQYQSLDRFRTTPFYDTSAKTGQNVEELFQNLAKSIIEGN